jgi:hypothetical protein
LFPTGIERRDDLGWPDRFDVYYGMADRRIDVARLDVPKSLPPGGIAGSSASRRIGVIDRRYVSPVDAYRSTHPTNMTQPVSTANDRKNPNFLLVVILSGITLLLLFLVAYFLLGDKGRKLLPGLHHDPQPTSYYLPSASDIVAA